MNHRLLTGIVSLALLGIPTLSPAQTETPEISTDGMQLVEKDRRGEIYADPGVDWGVYSKIMLDDASVAFRRHWQRDQNRYQLGKVSNRDMENIKSELAALFNQVFVEELTANGGFEIVETSADDVLRITPHIVDLDIYAPDTGTTTGRSRSYTDSSGKMTLKLELYDSVTGDLIAAASDRQESPRRGYAQWTSSVTNKRDARLMLQKWAESLRTRLNEAAGTPGEE